MPAMKTKRPTKDDRRAHRKARDRHRGGDGVSLRTFGDALDAGFLGKVLAAAQLVDPLGAWPDIAPRILPVLKRLHHPYPPDAAPLYVQVQPGLWTGFAIDLGPAFSHVSPMMFDQWGIDRATLVTTALDNVRQRLADEPPRVDHFDHDGVDAVAISGQGWGSSLILVPDMLPQYLGTKPRILLAPIRNTLISLPDDVDVEFVVAMWEALADGAPDELDIDPLRWTGSTVVPMGGPSSSLVN